ncbi:MAG: FtsX-like permease family protein [Chloroflexi bacterium]|nr:FtsX-like permease family protein [Chloroflexota bacterium]
MDSMFGLSMNIIMWVLLGVLGIALSAVGYVIVRSRVMFIMGVRNMPRRVAQTTLIIIGLMLSTLIIAAAFTTGDTVNYSLSATSYGLLGHTDEWVVLAAEQDGPPRDIESSISQETTDGLRAALSQASISEIDGVLPVLRGDVPVINPRSRQSEPVVNIAGLDTASLDGFPDIVSIDSGEVLDVGALAANEVYMNESAADDLATEVGDRIQVFVQNERHEFIVVDIVTDTILSGVGDFGDKAGLVTRLDTLQALFQRPGEVSFILISNKGGIRGGLELTDDVLAGVRPVLATADLDGEALSIYDVKRDLVESSELAGNIMTTFFLIFGLFSIAAGMLLIVMIFVMLAAERKPELGMARAVGTKRSHLMQMFMSEGMAYNMLAAMVGVGLGVLVAVGIANIMGRIFGDFFTITPHVTARSLIVSYSLGVVLTFVTVTFASWRTSNLNIVAAIRDLPETEAPNPEAGTLRGYLRGLLNAAVVVLTMPIGPLVLMLHGHTFGFPKREREYGEQIPLWPFIVLPLAPFYLVALLIVTLTRDRKPEGMPIWLVLSGVVLPPVGLVLVALQDRGRPIAWSAGFATLGVIFGGLLIQVGLASDTTFPFALGSSLAGFGLAAVLVFFGLRDRPVFTATGVILVVFWGLIAGGRLEPIFGELEGGIEMFFLSGIVMVTASTFVTVYNIDIVLAVLSRVGGLFGPILPAMKTAVAYPLASRFRTGMMMAMISLVIFALTMMSTMNLNFDRLFLNDSARGGWDIIVEENPNNPIDDLAAALEAEDSTAAESFRAVGRIDIAREPRVRQMNIGVEEFDEYPVVGADIGFVEGGDVPLSARAVGYESDAEVWQALAVRSDVAVVDRFAVESGGFDIGDHAHFGISGIDPEADVFDGVRLQVRDEITGLSRQVEVIGVIELGASASFFGIFISSNAFLATFGEPFVSIHVVALDDPGDSQTIAREIEATLLTGGVQAESLKKLIDDDQALGRNFFLLMQGFMGLGLFVGIAAVGVIAFRTVVERRQQIGMLRALGYKRSTVALSFMMESSFVTLLGIGSGVGLAIWLSYFLLTSDEFPTSDAGYAIPWLQIGIFSGLTFLASLVMTYIPSRQAASVPIADALRYE